MAGRAESGWTRHRVGDCGPLWLGGGHPVSVDHRRCIRRCSHSPRGSSGSPRNPDGVGVVCSNTLHATPFPVSKGWRGAAGLRLWEGDPARGGACQIVDRRHHDTARSAGKGSASTRARFRVAGQCHPSRQRQDLPPGPCGGSVCPFIVCGRCVCALRCQPPRSEKLSLVSFVCANVGALPQITPCPTI